MSSPRRALSPQEKLEKDEKYRVTKREYTTRIGHVAAAVGTVFKLDALYNRAKLANASKDNKGAKIALRFTHKENGTKADLTSQQLTAAKREIISLIKELARYNTSKRTVGAKRPNEFSGVYSPIYLGDALKYFFATPEANFGPVSPKFVDYMKNGGDVDTYIRYFQEANVAIGQRLAAAQAEAARISEQYEQQKAYMAANLVNRQGQDPVQAANDAITLKALHKASIMANKTYYLVEDEYIVLSGGIDCATTSANDLQACLSGSLVDKLVTLKSGYAITNSLVMLFHIYCGANNLTNAENAQYTTSNQHMQNSFNSSINSIFKLAPNDEKVASDVNTYTALTEAFGPQGFRGKYKNDFFTPELFKTFFFPCIISYNSLGRKYLEQDPQFAAIAQQINSEEIRRGMLADYHLIKAARSEWAELIEPERKARTAAKAKAKKTTKADDIIRL